MRGLLMVTCLAAAAAGAQDDDTTKTTVLETTKGTEGAFPRIHLFAIGAFDFVARQTMPELGASYAVANLVDLGLTLTLGSSVGVHALIDVHTGWYPDTLFRPFVQLRGSAYIASRGYGGTLWAGATADLGPGRIKFGPAAAVFAESPGYFPYAVMAMVGYELDLLRPATNTVERTVIKETTAVPVVVEQKVEQKAATTLLRARLVDVDDRPVNGTLRFPKLNGRERTYEASPQVEIELEPGEYRIEAEADGFLVRGRTISIKEGETLTTDFVLRAVPKVKTASLQATEVEISHQINFEFAKSTILPDSYFILDEVVDLLLRNRQIRQLRIEGHTDDVGGAERNQVLSEDRALAVTKYLVEHGVEANRLQSQGFGLTKPIASNKSEVGRAKNRRVQFKIIEQ